MIIDVAAPCADEAEPDPDRQQQEANDAAAKAHAQNVENHERARQREIAAYLSAAFFPLEIPYGPGPNPFINQDATLNALVQLGALRLDSKFAFLSFIDRETQWVVAEMTRTHRVSEMKWDGDDHIWLGVAKLEACWGVCPTTMKAFMDETGEWARRGPNVIANTTRYIVHDFRSDPAYKDRPYVTAYPWFTSYLEVPLVSPLGYLLGSYCVVDDKLHDYDNDYSVGIMNEIAATIMDHLDLVRLKQNRDRSDKLIDGLSVFIGSDPLPPPAAQAITLPNGAGQPPMGLETAPSSNGHYSDSRPPPPSNFVSSSSIQSSVSGPSLPTYVGSPDTPLTSVGDELSEDPIGSIGSQVAPDVQGTVAAGDVNGATGASHANGFISSANIKSAFFRAATTIRQAMDMDGLMFLDAVPTAYVNEHDQSTPSPPTEASGPFCAAIVQSTGSGADSPRIPGQSSQTRLPEAALQRFIRRYPRGHVFSADEFGPIEEVYAPGKPWPGLNRSDDRENLILRNDVATLFHVLPAAKYIVFLPLWHFQRECWYAAALGWVTDPTCAIETSDISLVAAFGNCVMAQVARMETMAASRAKTSFVSSISHELRSPLHGILASSELLRESISDPTLLSTLDMLDSCGKTLLDTFTNLLDHAISIKDGKASKRKSESRMRISDLGHLVEDVVEAVHFSHLSENAFQTSLRPKGVYSIYSSANAAGGGPPPDHPLLIVLNIAKRPSWDMLVDVGAWKRIVMNIYSNALKYTKAGRIEVGLKVVQKPDRNGILCDHISFTVEDTGKGMSSDYLKYRLFTPFSQEDAYSPGIGLGLSIVQQLASGLGGTIEVKSSVGVGTLVEVCLPVKQEAITDVEMVQSPDMYPLSGRSVCLITPEAYFTAVKQPVKVTPEMKKRAATVERVVRTNAGDVLGMDVIPATVECPVPKADIYLLDGDVASEAVKSGCPPETFIPSVSPLVLLCSGAGPPACVRHKVLKSHGHHLHHPIGPRKIGSVFDSALKNPCGVSPPHVDVKSEEWNPFVARQLLPSRPKMPEPGAAYHGSQSPLPQPALAETGAVAQKQYLSEAVSSPSNTITPGAHIPVSSQQEKPLGTLHLLLVDDNPINIKLLAAVVKKLNHSFETASHGLEAVNLYRASLEPQNRRFDTIFMDISMPVMDGFEAIREIRRLENEAGIGSGQGCKIAALTGLSSEVSRKEAFASGSNLFLTKPVKLGMVRKVLEGGMDGEMEGLGLASPSPPVTPTAGG
ncbi:autoinducer 2 sensor kinase/phosphatase luxQ [Apodospora peruviana]|uniref:histidine kinase n=1 Tax=Apodospora peruviana TaxID=516989 RepID=A0AAE0I1D7_9PEZI|nr:autoinducer 2 sensor kinase/phosphatase luxQ [Apodospora peruviana]